MRGFVVLPKQWIVERLFAHLMRSRRLVPDFDRSTGSAEAMVYWSMPLHDPPPGPATAFASVNRPGADSASHPRAASRFAFERNASIFAGAGSRPKQPAISWHVSGP